MIKLAKYLKPFALILLIAVGVMFLQAVCDLALPDYMSDIVNGGIQQGGVDTAVPEAVHADKMQILKLFISKDDMQMVNESYKQVGRSAADYKQYLKKYPALANEDIYVLTDKGKTQTDLLAPVVGKALLITAGIENLKNTAKNGVIDFNGQKIPANTDLFAVLASLPAAQRETVMKSINQKFASYDESMINQAAASLVKKEYEALGMDTGKMQSAYIFNKGLIMLLLSLLSAACTIAVGFIAARMAAGVSRNMRRDVFIKVENFTANEFDKFSTASLITRTTNDITQIQMLIVIGIRMLTYAPIIGIGGAIKALGKSVSMGWIIALAVVILISLIGSVFFVAVPKFKIIQKLTDRLNLVTRENLSGMMVIRAFNTQKFEEDRFDKANMDLTDTNLFVNRVMVVMFPIMMLLMNGVMLLIVWVGANQIANLSMRVGDMMAFMQYTMQIIFAFLMMSFMFILIPRASVSAARIGEILETKPTIADPEKAAHFGGAAKGVVEFRQVDFHYPGADGDVLEDITFTAKPGQTTAIIGSTGSGKSTLVNLIPRFYDVTGGQILIDGTDIREVTQQELRACIGYVPQEATLFQGTIASNIRYGSEQASAEEVTSAAEIAQAADIIAEKTEGIESEITQEGTNVSGGQKQRLSIARAIVKNPRIYIFDDCFSALDYKTDSALRKALKQRVSDSTIIIIAQRISTIKSADQILVLDNGKIVGAGTHSELMQNCDTYKEIALSQLSKEELA